MQFEAARRLSPKDPHAAGVLSGHAAALFGLERFEESVDFASMAMQSANPRHWNHALLVAALAKMGRRSEMKAAKKELFSQYPDFTISKSPGGGIAKMIAPVLREIGFPE